MKVFARFFVLLLLVSIFSCKDKTPSQTDNLFAFKEYIAYHTYGNVSVKTPIKIQLVKPLDQFEINQEIPAGFLTFSPTVTGKLIVENSNTLIFQPQNKLNPNTVYTLTLKLDELYDDLPSEFNTYTFSIKTLSPNFHVTLGNLQSHDKQTQYLTGSIEANDFIAFEKAKQLIKATQEEQNIPIVWEDTGEDAKFFNFTIDPIKRNQDDSKISISWDGSSIGSSQKGENTLVIPGQNNFKIIGLKTTIAPQASLQINFSDPLKENQQFTGLVSIDKTSNLRFEVSGNVLTVYPAHPITGKVRVQVFQGIKNTENLSLKKDFSELVSFEQIKPAVRLLSKGVILPASSTTPFYFETVNLTAVDVRIIKVFENNMLQFLQDANLNASNYYDLKKVGRRIAKKTITLENTTPGIWQAQGINLSNLFQAEPGAMYQIEISFKKEYVNYTCSETTSDNNDDLDEEDYYYEDTAQSLPLNEEEREEQYWDNELYRWRTYTYNWEQRDNPCHPAYYNEDRIIRSNILGSDLGIIVKKGNNKSYHIIAANLLTAKPEAGTKVSLYNYQQQLLGTATTDANGTTIFDSDKSVAFVVAQKGSNYAYAKLNDGNALSLSNFDVSGKKLQKGIKGFLYTERGVYRPGDTIHLSFVLNDNVNKLPKGHPVKLSVTDAKGKLVQQAVYHTGNNAGLSKEGFFYFPVPTQKEAPTGNWLATVSLGGAQFSKTLKVATIKPNRLKIKLDFNEDILSAKKPVSGTAEVLWLHGAPARNLKLTMDVTIQNAGNTAFEKYPQYRFSDPIRSFDTMEMPFFEGKLNSEGVLSFSKNLEVSNKAPGMLQATFVTKAFEGGGDFSMDVFTKKIAPYSHFVGLQSPETKNYGSYETDKNIAFNVVSVDEQGTASGNRKLEVKVFQIAWRWWWSRGYDNLSRYENASMYKPFKEFTVTTNTNGKANFTINIPDEEGGRYLIRVIDPSSGHATGRIAYFYENWWKSPTDTDPESAKMLVFSADKEHYNVNEKATITFPSSAGGRALLSIENGTEVLSTQWIETQKGETKATVELTKEMTPNVYVNISLLQPHHQTQNDLPIRLYGVIPLLIEDPNTVLHPTIQMPDELRPEETFTVKVNEQNGKKMTYTLAIVDEGLLDLTRFSTPNIHQAFYTREALGVKTFDVYDYVIGAYSGSVSNIYAVGGGDVAAGAKNRKADRFKPVVKFLGPFTLKKGKTASNQITMPNYIGSVRTMVIAGDNENNAYGNTEKTTPVRKPLMVLASLPRKLSPGEKVTLPVTVFAMDKKIKNVKVKVTTGNALKPLGATTKTITFDSLGEQIVNFDFEVLPATSFQTIDVVVSGTGEKASTQTEIDIFNPNPVSQKTTHYVLEGNATQEISFSTFGVAGSNGVELEFSTLPPMDFTKRMEYLIQYPHGCVEQTTSSGFPQLYLADIFDLTFDKKQTIEKNIKATIRKLGDFQLPNGGLSYWRGTTQADDWGTSYAGHFMLEAKQKGYALPISFLGNWLHYQQQAARQWQNGNTWYNSSLTQAYRLFTLALAGKPELAAMNRLRESNRLSNEAKWRLAAAYALAGKSEAAQQIIQTANIDFVTNDYNYYSYGSVFRNRAMALETMVLLNDPKQREVSIALAKNLSSSRWYSTQETAYALVALAKMVAKNGGKSMDVSVVKNGKTTSINTQKAIANRAVSFVMGSNLLSVKNNKNNVIYVSVIQTGKLPLGEELQEQKNLRVNTVFYDGSGATIDVSDVRQGTEITAKITVTNTTADWIGNLALTQLLPSGWEIVNTSYSALGTGSIGNADYIDIRDDRIHVYFDLDKRKSKTFTLKINTSYLGTYYLPGTQVEAMYDHTYFARNKGMWVKVKN